MANNNRLDALNRNGSTTRKRPMYDVDIKVIEAHIAKNYLGEKEFASENNLGLETIRRIRRGEGVLRCTLRKLAAAMGKTRVSQLLLNPPQTDNSLTPAQRFIGGEWESAGAIENTEILSNGLRCRIHRMRHRYKSNLMDNTKVMGRGKCYELDGLYDRERDRVHEYFRRHPEICSTAGPHPNLPVNLGCFPDASSNWWWVIDEWFAGKRLSEVLPETPLAVTKLKTVMRQIADGLARLHSVGVIRRELGPKNIMFDTTTNRIVLTDFELGKLSDGRPTVSKSEWPQDPYRAPEVGKERLGVRADLFSWGRVFIRAATGTLPARGTEEAALKKNQIPGAIRDVVLSCVEDVPRHRPVDLATVLQTLSRWP